LIPNTILEHKAHTVVTVDAGRRGIRLRDGFSFASFASLTSVDSDEGLHEQQLWELAGILFDDISDVPQSLSPEAAAAYSSRARKELLSAFWAKLVRPAVESAVEKAESPEDKAFVYLSGGNTTEACAALLGGMNYHLAQLVAQNRGDGTFRETMAQQLKDWDAIEVTSEMNDSIRTIYHLLAGETAECGGNPQGGMENRKAAFRFSSRFELGWQRAFGLRLWYGILEGDDLASAVDDFAHDLGHGETAQPLSGSGQDALWSLLRLYSSMRSGSVDTESTALDSLSGDARLGFELATLLQSAGVLHDMDDLSDSLAIAYAASLAPRISADAQVLVLACWVLTHVADASAQETNLRSLLDRFGDILSTSQSICDELVSDGENGLWIPLGWISSSKALYARNVLHDAVAEVRFLIEGGELRQAHDVISQTVGPAAVIEDDYASLRDIAAMIKGTDMRRGAEWERGAGLYFDYADLTHAETRGAEAKLGKKLAVELEAALTEGGKSAAEKVALQMMASSVADITRRASVSVIHLTGRTG
jgi:nuclear pore complex protein Nup98-Nup96